MEVVVLTQQACAFCEQAKTILGRLAEEYPIRIVVFARLVEPAPSSREAPATPSPG